MNQPSANGQEPLSFQLELDNYGRLVLIDATGQRYVGVDVVRAFPISAPSAGIAITSALGQELAWIDDLGSLPPSLRSIIETHWARQEFVPVIQRIVKVRTLADKSEWQVQTDRGPTTFQLQSDHDVRSLEGQRALIVDTNGIRYLINNITSLDAASRRHLERFL